MTAVQILSGTSVMPQSGTAGGAEKTDAGASADFVSLLMSMMSASIEGEVTDTGSDSSFIEIGQIGEQDAGETDCGDEQDGGISPDAATVAFAAAFAMPMQQQESPAAAQTTVADPGLTRLTGPNQPTGAMDLAGAVAPGGASSADSLSDSRAAEPDTGEEVRGGDFEAHMIKGGSVAEESKPGNRAVRSEKTAFDNAKLPNLRMSPSALRDAFRAVVGRGAENSAKTVLFSQTGRQAALFPRTNGERVIFAERVIPAERMMPAFEGGSEPVRVENASQKWASEMGADNSAEVAAAAAGNITAAGSRSARAEKSERQPGAREVAGAAKIGQMQLAGAARPEVRRVELTEISAKEAGAAGAAGLRQGAGITRQLTEAISGRVRRGEMSAFKIRLKPEGLGEVTVRLSRDGNRLEVELSAQLKSTRELIARDLDALQGALNTGNTGRFSSVSVTLGAETAQNAFAGLAGGEHGRGGRDAERWQNDAWPNISSDAEEKKPLGDIRRFTGRLIDYKV